MNGTIESGHADQDKLEALLDFREELIKLRENNENRSLVRRMALPRDVTMELESMDLSHSK